MAMADLDADPQGRAQVIEGDPVEPVRTKGSGEKLLARADHNLAAVPVDLQDEQGRAGRDAQALALAHGEVVNAAMRADHFPAGRDQFAGSIGQPLALLFQVSFEELLVVAAGNKADL